MAGSSKMSMAAPRRSAFVRALFAAAGLLFLALGIVGAFLPVLPTTPFVILAGACFARASSRLENWLLDHPYFGPGLRDWRTRRAIPRTAKMLAVFGMSVGFLSFWLALDPEPWLSVLVAALMLSGLAYVLSRPG